MSMPVIVWVIYAFFIGLLFGSFANVVIYRLPRGLSIVSPPSACTACGKRLMLLDLIPVASWLALRASCRFCRTRISVRYPLVELACAVLFSCVVFFSFTFSALPLAFLGFLLLCVSMIDTDTQEIPDGLLAAGLVAGVAWVTTAQFIPELLPLAPAWYDALIGTAVGAALIVLLKFVDVGRGIFTFKKTPLMRYIKNGFAYVKLTAVSGLFLGWHKIITAFVFAAFLFCILVFLHARNKEKKPLPFAPFLSVGILLAFWIDSQFYIF
jgi:leader peptidase (prepilin peptidase)/N-methyltransferase